MVFAAPLGSAQDGEVSYKGSPKTLRQATEVTDDEMQGLIEQKNKIIAAEETRKQDQRDLAQARKMISKNISEGIAPGSICQINAANGAARGHLCIVLGHKPVYTDVFMWDPDKKASPGVMASWHPQCLLKASQTDDVEALLHRLDECSKRCDDFFGDRKRKIYGAVIQVVRDDLSAEPVPKRQKL